MQCMNPNKVESVYCIGVNFSNLPTKKIKNQSKTVCEENSFGLPVRVKRVALDILR